MMTDDKKGDELAPIDVRDSGSVLPEQNELARLCVEEGSIDDPFHIRSRSTGLRGATSLAPTALSGYVGGRIDFFSSTASVVRNAAGEVIGRTLPHDEENDILQYDVLSAYPVENGALPSGINLDGFSIADEELARIVRRRP